MAVSATATVVTCHHNDNETGSWAESEPLPGETGLGKRHGLPDPHWMAKRPRAGAVRPQP